MKKPTKFISLTVASLMAMTALAGCKTPTDTQSDPQASAGVPTEAPSTEPTAGPSEAPNGEHEHDHGEDPSKISIGRVGTVEYTLQDYIDIFAAYADDVEGTPDLNQQIKDQLIEIGVIKTYIEQSGLKLDEDEEQQVRELVDEDVEGFLQAMPIDSSLTDEEEIRAARIKAMNELLADYGLNYEAYVEEQEKNMREYLLNQKLREHVAADVEINDEQVLEYFNEQIESERELYEANVEEFANAFNAYLNKLGGMPLYTPEGMFTVKHLLIQFENFEDVSDTVDGVFGEDQNARIEAVRAALEGGITLEDFVENYVSNEEYNDDEVFLPSDDSDDPYAEYAKAYREHGYIMNEQLINRYFVGFGEAACALYHGEDWRVPESIGDASEAPIEKYGIKFYETTDGHRIAEVQSNCMGGGIHFIFVGEELDSGEAKMDLGNENDPIYSSMVEDLEQELVNMRFEECYLQWKQDTAIELDDATIDHYAHDHLGIS